MRHKFIVIYVTSPSRTEAKRIISELLKRKLVACGNILGKIDSVFFWKGRQEKAQEVLILLKTRRDLFGKVVSEIGRIHSYEVPEIIAVPIIAGNKEYLEWIDEATRGSHFLFYSRKN